MSDETTSAPVKKSKKKISLKKAAVVVVFLIAVGAAGYFYYQYNDIKNNTEEAIAEKNQEDSNRVTDKLKVILFIPEEAGQPTVARVDDPEVLKKANPDFYKNAAVGDYLILYPNRAIIYRESSNQIINIAPIVNTDELTGNKKKENSSSEQPAETQPEDPATTEPTQ